MLNTVLRYKGYFGCIEKDSENGVFYGKIKRQDGPILFEGKTFNDIEEAFRSTVEKYLIN